jgi:hypothetical protein
MIRRRYLRNRARGNIIYPGLIAAWSAKGKTNDDEEKEIPKNIVDLIEQNGIQFAKAGKPVDNPDKYSISIDVDTNKITVVTK